MRFRRRGSALFRKRPPAPREAVIGLDKDERVQAWAEATDRSYLVATRRGLHLTKGEETRLLGWHEITKAVWREGQLTVVESAELDDSEIMDLPPWTVELREPGTLAVVIRQRVEASVVITRQERVAGGSVRIVGRKVAGVDGLLWQFRADADLDTGDPRIRAAVLEVVGEERERGRPIDL